MKTIVESFLSLSETASSVVGRSEPNRVIIYEKNDFAELEVLPGPTPRVSVRIKRISTSGIRLWTKTQIQQDAKVRIQLHADTVISGEVRYSWRRDDGFDTVIRIQDVTCRPELGTAHIHCAELALYLVGRQLSRRDVVRVKSHIRSCRACCILLTEIHSALFGPEARRPSPISDLHNELAI